MRLGKVAVGFVAAALAAWAVAFAADAAGAAAVKTVAQWAMLLAIPLAVIAAMAGIAFDKDRRLATIAAAMALALWLIRLLAFVWPAVREKLR